jgi:hypothetical protein
MLRQMRSLRAIAAVWGVGGTAALLVYAIARLAPVARVGLAQGMPPWGWAATAAWIAFMAYFEGYRGFQRGFAPRAVERARALARDPRPLRVALAPLYCMSLFAAERRRLVAAWALLAFIVGFVIAVRGVGQPARGAIDAGVVVGLSWGLVALALASLRALVLGGPRGTTSGTRASGPGRSG